MNALEKIKKIKVVPVIVINDQGNAEKLAESLINGGLPVAEVTFRTPAAENAIKRMKAYSPDILVGAGTVINAEQAERAVAAGADFIVSPGLSESVADYCRQKNVLYIPGCVTPYEIMKAIDCGAKVIKFFPAGAFGGLKTLKSLAAPFGSVEFMPTGGVNEDNLSEYLSFNKIAACGGSWMAEGKLIDNGKFDEIESKCRAAAEIAAKVRA